MARPAKATKTLSGHATKDEVAEREEVENALRGDGDKLQPPEWLNDGQRQIFSFVIEEMEASGVLGNLDIYVLTQFAVATERMFSIERSINESDMAAGFDKETMFARNSYVKDFFRGANELSLSPQARAKIGTLNLAKKKEETDPLKKLLAGKG